MLSKRIWGGGWRIIPCNNNYTTIAMSSSQSSHFSSESSGAYTFGVYMQNKGNVIVCNSHAGSRLSELTKNVSGSKK